jgi:cell division septation protein DedD
MAGNSDEDLRIHRIGSVDPMEELSDLDMDEDADGLLDDDEDVREAPRGRLLPVATAVFALLGFAGITWYAYQWSTGEIAPEELPVIRAETTPSKIRPESPGGLEVPYQETLALNDIQPDPEKPQVERLLPPPETPLPPPKIALPPAPAEATPEPSDAANSVTAVPAAPAVPPEPSTAETPPEPAVPPAPAVAAPSDGFLLQLASLKSRERAPGEWSRLQKSFPNLLGNRELVVLSVNLADRGTFYRVQAGFYPDRASAEAACQQLKAKSQDCLVTKR